MREPTLQHRPEPTWWLITTALLLSESTHSPKIKLFTQCQWLDSLVTASQVKLHLSWFVCRPRHQCLSSREDFTGCCCSSGQPLPIRFNTYPALQTWGGAELSDVAAVLAVSLVLRRFALCWPPGRGHSRSQLAFMCARLSLLANWTVVVKKENWETGKSVRHFSLRLIQLVSRWVAFWKVRGKLGQSLNNLNNGCSAGGR